MNTRLPLRTPDAAIVAACRWKVTEISPYFGFRRPALAEIPL